MSQHYKPDQIHKAQQQRYELRHGPSSDGTESVYHIRVSEQYGMEVSVLRESSDSPNAVEFMDIQKACAEARSWAHGGGYAEVVDESGKVHHRYGKLGDDAGGAAGSAS